MNDLRKLLPCPFCGGAVRFCGDVKSEDCKGCHRIICDNCGDFDTAHGADPENLCETLDSLRAKGAEHWNRRARIDAALAEKVEPVAWRWKYVGGDYWHFGADKPKFAAPESNFIVEPLYAHSDQWRRVEDGLPEAYSCANEVSGLKPCNQWCGNMKKCIAKLEGK